MKLFIWADPYQVHYGSSMCFAVAESLEEAKCFLLKAKRYSFGKHEQGVGGLEPGEPTRILELPCAEWHEWSE